MTGYRRGFARERHTRLKVAVTVFALAVFGLGWFQLSANHRPASAGTDAALVDIQASATVIPGLPPTLAATLPTGGGSPAAPSAPAATAGSPATPTPATGKPTPARKPRTSRGS